MSKNGDWIIRETPEACAIVLGELEARGALREAHARLLEIAERLLPPTVEPEPPMPMLSEDDVNLMDLSAEELDAAWDLWFDLAQTTNDSDPLYSHGVFVNVARSASRERSAVDRATGHRGSATEERSRGTSEHDGTPS